MHSSIFNLPKEVQTIGRHGRYLTVLSVTYTIRTRQETPFLPGLGEDPPW